MVRELLGKLSDHLPPLEPEEDSPPSMFQRSADVPASLQHVRHGEQISKLHREWLVRIVAPMRPSAGQRAIRVIRRVSNRTGSVDREIVADLIRAIDALANRCDELSDRLEHQSIVLNDAVTIFGEELTRLRAESTPLLAGDLGDSPDWLPND
jgi:hypothetical protein